MPTPSANPRVAFVIPCYNHGRFVGDAVGSALAQRDAEVRVVVVDDGSTDGTTPQACDALPGRFGAERVRVVHQQNTGLPGARNRGAREADEEYLVFLDADDTVAPEFAARLAAAIAAAGDPRVSHAYCQETLTDRAHGTWRVPEWDPELLLITNLHPVTCLVRRDAFEAAGGFDAGMTEGYEDWEFWVRLSGRGYRGVRVAEPLFFWRRHSQETMVHDAVRKHDRLYGQIIERHRGLYGPRFEALARRCNSMLRAFDCNWIDETGRPIPLQYLERKTAEAHALERRLTDIERRLVAARARADALAERTEAVRAEYEAMAVVRLHHRVHRALAASPRLVRAPALATLRLLKPLLSGGRAASRHDGKKDHR
ncbi:MAG TPA: glycosyltransferase family A protein [Phycisphaerales bacterium]|nr:glycosyltransferase family A protein [Phycisphaerales bacterium]